MKKKLLSFVLLAVLCFGSTINAHATTIQTSGESADINVSYEVPSNYSINIPAEIHLDGTKSFKLTAECVNLRKNQKLYVSVASSEVQLTNEYGDKGNLYISTDLTNEAPTILAYFEPRQLESEHTITFTAGSPTFAGVYSGTVTFNFYIL